MSTIKVNAIQHSGGNNASITLSSNGAVAFSNTIIFSDGSTQTGSANSFLNPTVTTSTYIGNANMSGGAHYFTYSDDYFGAEISSDYRLTNDVTYARVQGRLPHATSSGSSNPTFWALIVSHATGVAANNNPLTIVSGWKFRLPNGNDGDVFNFDFDEALESFGSAKIPSTGYYYIGWAHTYITGRVGATSGSWFADSTGDTFPQGSGTMFYKYRPGPITPTTFNSFDGNRVAKGIHFRLYPKNNVFAANGFYTIRTDKILSNHSIRVDNKLAGVYELVNHTGWTSNTSAVYTTFQPGLYSHYKLIWDISHAPLWERTYLRFFDYGATNITSGYYNSGFWLGSTGTSFAINSTYFGNNQGFVWLAGNGVDFKSQGYAIITCGDDYIYGLGVNRAVGSSNGNRAPTIRGSSTLYGYGTGDSYMEEFAGSYAGSTAVAGFCIFGSGGASRLGNVWVYGARYE